MAHCKQVSENEYQKVLALQIINNNFYTEHFRGSRKTLIVFGREVCSSLSGGGNLDIGNITNRQFKSFLGTFKRGLYNQFSKNPELSNLKIEFNGVSKGKNKPAFKKLRNFEYYWNIDLSSAYWQIGYRLGYISEGFYTKYISNSDYKVAKRLCFSFLARTNWREYNSDKESFVIKCESEIENDVYKNVRKELYTIIAGAVEVAGDQCIDFNIDAISVTKEKRDEIINYFDALGLGIKVNRVTKINDTQIEIKGNQRNF